VCFTKVHFVNTCIAVIRKLCTCTSCALARPINDVLCLARQTSRTDVLGRVVRETVVDFGQTGATLGQVLSSETGVDAGHAAELV
jgi:hypothetical protein